MVTTFIHMMHTYMQWKSLGTLFCALKVQQKREDKYNVKYGLFYFNQCGSGRKNLQNTLPKSINLYYI